MELSHKTDFVKVFMKNENFMRILIRFANGIVNSQDFGSVSQYSKRDNSDNPHGHLCVKQLSKATILERALADPDGVFVSHNPLVKFQTTFLNLDVYSVYIIYLFLNEHAPPISPQPQGLDSEKNIKLVLQLDKVIRNICRFLYFLTVKILYPPGKQHFPID